MRKTLVLSIVLALATGFTYAIAFTNDDKDQEVRKGSIHELNPAAATAATAGSTAVVTPSITYHGGPVLTTPTIYYIWYGNWNQKNSSDTPDGQQILRDFGTSLGGSPYFAINTTYGLSGSVQFGGETSDNYSRGARLRDSDILTIVTTAIKAKGWGNDPTAVFFVLTSSDVSESSGFCNKYCGWHTAQLSSSGAIRYSFVGNASRCLSSCAPQTISPNGNAGADAMASIIAHELEEAATDPNLNAWYDSKGAENADKCAWTFGQNVQKLTNGAQWNVQLGSRKFLIQRNLKHGTGGDTCNMDLTNQ